MTDARAVFEVMARDQLRTGGRVEIEEADIVGDWQRPSFEIGSSTVGVLESGRLIAYAEVSGGDRGDACVDPDYLGRGIGTWLAHWMQSRARSRGAKVIGMPVRQGSPGDRLLAALGYRVRWTTWVLELPEGAVIPPRDLPTGYAVREAHPAEHAGVHDLIEDAFLEWSERERQPFEDFDAQVVGRPGFEPWTLRVVTDATGALVAAAVVLLTEEGEGYVERLATRADQRGRGLAQALLVDAFAVAREHGATRSGLSTDTRTGALSLYEKVGMVVTQTWVNRAIEV